MSGVGALGAAGNVPAAGESARVRKAAEEFTAVALAELLSPMFAGVAENGGTFGGGVGEATFRPMLINEMAKSLAHAGGLGLTESVARGMQALQDAARRDREAAPRATTTGRHA